MSVIDKISRFKPKKTFPVVLGCGGIATGAAAAVLLSRWIEYDAEYSAETSFSRQEKLAEKQRPLSAGAYVAGTVSLAALSVGTLLFVRNNFIHDRQYDIGAATFLRVHPVGMTVVLSFPISSPQKKGAMP